MLRQSSSQNEVRLGNSLATSSRGVIEWIYLLVCLKGVTDWDPLTPFDSRNEIFFDDLLQMKQHLEVNTEIVTWNVKATCRSESNEHFMDQYQYPGNCPPTPPLTQQQSIDDKLRLMLG